MIKIQGQRISAVFALILFCVFAASVLAVVMLGINAYKNVAEISREGYDEHACLSYIWTKVKNADETGKVAIGSFQGLSSLCLYEEYNGVMYQTMIYAYEGWMYELFSEAELTFYPEDGIPVLQTDWLSFEWTESGLLKAQTNSGCLYLYPRCKTGTFIPEGGMQVE